MTPAWFANGAGETIIVTADCKQLTRDDGRVQCYAFEFLEASDIGVYCKGKLRLHVCCARFADERRAAR